MPTLPWRRAKEASKDESPAGMQMETLKEDTEFEEDKEHVVADEPDEEIELDNLEEKLTTKWPQQWALGLGMLALPMLCWATRVPISCVEHTEAEKLAPKNCTGLDGDAQTLRLPNFCWQACYTAHKMPVLCLLAIGVFMQGGLVILNRKDCANWLRLIWYFDIYNLLEKHRDDKDFGKIMEEKAQRTRFSVIDSLPFVKDKFSRGVGSVVHKAQVEAKNKLSKELTRSDAHDLASAKWASFISKLCILMSLFNLCLVIITNYSHHPVAFTCEGPQGNIHVARTPFHRPLMFLALCSCVGILSVVVLLQRTAAWTIQITVTNIDAMVLKQQFRQMHDAHGTVKYFVNHDVQPCKRELSSLRLYELHLVDYLGTQFKPEAVLGKVPQQGKSTEVRLHFKKRKPPKLLDNVHRKRALFLMGAAALLMYLAGTSCWTCIKEIHAYAGTSVTELDKYLLLMGGCGRHAAIGVPCKLGCLLFVLAIIQQVIIFVCTPKTDQPISRNQLLFLTLADFRKMHVQNASMYEDAGVPMPEFSCHVWVVGKESEGEKGEKVTNCIRSKGLKRMSVSVEALSDSGMSQASRAPDSKVRLANLDSAEVVRSAEVLAEPEENEKQHIWRRSTRPKTVRLVQVPSDTRRTWAKHLMRPQEYNPPTICIEFDVKDVQVKQIVPPEFVAGHFHAAVNLGPKVGWEKSSAAIVLLGCMLAFFDLVCFFFSGVDGSRGLNGSLTRCTDILNRPSCQYLHVSARDQQSTFTFRHSIGPYAAMAASLVGLWGMLELRVAYVDPNLQSSCGCKCLQAYMKGLLFGFSMPIRLLRGMCIDFYNCLVSMRRRSCEDLKEDFAYRMHDDTGRVEHCTYDLIQATDDGWIDGGVSSRSVY